MDRHGSRFRRLAVGGYFNEFMEFYMSFFSTIAAVKSALVESLLGNNPHVTECGFTKPYKPVYANPGYHTHRPHPAKPSVCQTQPAKPGYGSPHPHPVNEYHQPCSPSYPLFPLNR